MWIVICKTQSCSIKLNICHVDLIKVDIPVVTFCLCLCVYTFVIKYYIEWILIFVTKKIGIISLVFRFLENFSVFLVKRRHVLIEFNQKILVLFKIFNYFPLFSDEIRQKKRKKVSIMFFYYFCLQIGNLFCYFCLLTKNWNISQFVTIIYLLWI